MYDLFGDQQQDFQTSNTKGLSLLKGFVSSEASEIYQQIMLLVSAAPTRTINTPGGKKMSVLMSNCGSYGWVSDAHGYRYTSIDPATNMPWPKLPESFLRLANAAAQKAGYGKFVPDACVINCYEPNARMSLHQDKNEQDFSQPIVSFSIGLPAVFLFGGKARSDKPERILLEHGDAVVWGGSSRLNFHGVEPIRYGHHQLTGAKRWNLTFRQAV